MNRLFFSAVAICFTLLISGRADVWHDPGTPVRSSSPLQWVALAWKDAPKALNAEGVFGVKILPENDPLTLRTQFWLNALDQSLRDQYGNDMLKVPKPIAVVIQDPSANAYVMNRTSCLQMPVEVLSKEAIDAKRIGAPVRKTGFVNRVELFSHGAEGTQDSCDYNRQGEVSPEEVRKFFAPKLKHCKIELNGIGIRLSDVAGDPEHCMDSDNDKTLATGINWNSRLNLVVVHTGMFSSSDGDVDLVVTLAHELGHYYRAQALHDRYGFFYQLSENGINHHPKPVDDNDALIDEYRKYKESLPLGFSDQSALKPALQDWIVNQAPLSFTKSPECVKARSVVDSPLFAVAIGRFFSKNPEINQGPVNENEQKLYLAYEKDALECLKTVEIPNSEVYRNEVVEGFSRSFKTTQAIMSLNDIPIGKTLSDVLATSDANLTQYLENQEKFMKQIVDRHLGLYTDEQEADDMEAELSFRMGFTAKEIIGAELAFQKVSEKEWREDYRPGTVYPKPYMDECERLLLNDWKDSPYIGIGNFDDNHHGGCFRVYNVSQEIRAHQYKDQKRVTPPALGFGVLKQYAQKLHDAKTI